MHNVHDALDEENEHGEHRDDDIPIGDAIIVSADMNMFEEEEDSQLIPGRRHFDGSIIGIGIEYLNGIAVPAMIGTFLPQARSIQIRVGNAKESEGSDGKWQLCDKEYHQSFWHAPFLSKQLCQATHRGRRR